MNRSTADTLFNRRMLRDFLRGSRLFFLLSMLASALSALAAAGCAAYVLGEIVSGEEKVRLC